MTRRGALLLLAPLIGRLVSMAQTPSGLRLAAPNEKVASRWDIDSFKSYTFLFDGKTVTLTPE